jgi:hypothetical protein
VVFNWGAHPVASLDAAGQARMLVVDDAATTGSGGGGQPADSDLTAIAALDSTTSGAIASDGSGWVKKTYAQLKTALGLAKADVGLGNVDNTADAAKPVSSAQQTALDAKAQALTPTAVKTSAYTAVTGDYVPVDISGGSVTLTLPTTPANGTRVGYKVVTVGTGNTLTVACGGSNVFNKTGGSTSLTASLLNQAALLLYAGGIWYVQADDLPLSQLTTQFGAILNTHLLAWTYAQAFRLAALRTDTAGTTSASATVTDTSILAADQGRPVSGTGIPTGSYVGTVTPGTSFLLSSSPTSQVAATATVTNASASITLASAARDANEAIVLSPIVWPDGSTGTFTTDTASTAFPGAIDAYHVTYVPASGPTKTITQTAVTRDTGGAVTAQPALVVT